MFFFTRGRVLRHCSDVALTHFRRSEMVAKLNEKEWSGVSNFYVQSIAE